MDSLIDLCTLRFLSRRVGAFAVLLFFLLTGPVAAQFVPWLRQVVTEDGPPSGIHFDFSPTAEGKLPEYVGGVIFGASTAPPEMSVYNQILIFDANGLEITDGPWRLEQPRVAPGTAQFSSIYDRFTGIYLPGGISRIVFSNAEWVDHLQYGYAIPEPSAATMALLLGAGLLNRRRR